MFLIIDVIENQKSQRSTHHTDTSSGSKGRGGLAPKVGHYSQIFLPVLFMSSLEMRQHRTRLSLCDLRVCVATMLYLALVCGCSTPGIVAGTAYSAVRIGRQATTESPSKIPAGPENITTLVPSRSPAQVSNGSSTQSMPTVAPTPTPTTLAPTLPSVAAAIANGSWRKPYGYDQGWHGCVSDINLGSVPTHTPAKLSSDVLPHSSAQITTFGCRDILGSKLFIVPNSTVNHHTSAIDCACR